MKKVITFAGLCALLVVVAIGAQAQKVKDIAVGEGAAKYSFANGIELIRLKHTDDYHRNYLIRAPRQKVWSYTQAITWFLNDRGYGMILFPDPRVKGAWKKHVELLIQRQPSEYWATQEKNKPEVFVKPEELAPDYTVKVNTYIEGLPLYRIAWRNKKTGAKGHYEWNEDGRWIKKSLHDSQGETGDCFEYHLETKRL